MKSHLHSLFIPGLVVLVSCASQPPKELVDARTVYQRASSGATAQAAPAELHVAHDALMRAEKSFEQDGDCFQTRDLAYVAHRKSELAEAVAATSIERKTQAQAENDFKKTQTKIVSQTKEDLGAAQAALVTSTRVNAQVNERLTAEKAARLTAEKRATEAQAALAKLAAVKEEDRGTVITLSGSVLFASGQSTLLPDARRRIDQVCDVLLANHERQLVVEGHTDSMGSDSTNMELSQRRADVVRDALLARGYGADLVRAEGMGESHPIANNNSAEGRANNRRVEIVITREPVSSR